MTQITNLQCNTNQSSKARQSFGNEDLDLKLRGNFLVSNGNNIAVCNFARFAANDVKGRQRSQLSVTKTQVEL